MSLINDRADNTHHRKKGSQQRMKMPMMMPSVLAALCSRFILLICLSLVGVLWAASCSVRALLEPPERASPLDAPCDIIMALPMRLCICFSCRLASLKMARYVKIMMVHGIQKEMDDEMMAYSLFTCNEKENVIAYPEFALVGVLGAEHLVLLRRVPAQEDGHERDDGGRQPRVEQHDAHDALGHAARVSKQKHTSPMKRMRKVRCLQQCDPLGEQLVEPEVSHQAVLQWRCTVKQLSDAKAIAISSRFAYNRNINAHRPLTTASPLRSRRFGPRQQRLAVKGWYKSHFFRIVCACCGEQHNTTYRT
ncbi:hypothetical protein FOCC_FOCC011104 [Frankliniella occidentalis]|nr:hypothetical protein FOCC_FOCC011104 [Frankliniella occidentalis]